MQVLTRGRYSARLAESRDDLAAAQALRHVAFIAGTGATPRVAARDADAYDPVCAHILVADERFGELVCCFRLLPLSDGRQIGASYAAQFYDLSGLETFEGRMVEMGRFCIRPGWRDPDILRVAWGAMTRFVDAERAEMLFGCSSFQGTDATAYADAFGLLRDRHLGPARWRPRVKALRVVRFARWPRRAPDARRAMATMPPLLRTYLAMGGWVSDHAVVDADMNTLHVFTGVEIGAIPPARARLLRAAAG